LAIGTSAHFPVVESSIAGDSSQRALVHYYRCPDTLAQVATSQGLSSDARFFEFRSQRCFGRALGAQLLQTVGGALDDLSDSVVTSGERIVLPFDLGEVLDNLRHERYIDHRDVISSRFTSTTFAEQLYYLLRPLMSVGFRRHLQQARLRGWDEISFPRWPVDSTVDDLMRQALRLLIDSNGARVPFIWFWPDGADSCTMMTHDVEGKAGLEFCGALMDLDDRFGVKASFQLIPEAAYGAWRYAPAIRDFEVNLHDLNHDGRLFRDNGRFRERARRINEYAREYGCRGFRSGAMYREQHWYSAFEFEYDMSVPNVAHLEPQRGGCCTVMPYFVGNILELPLTTSQDYTLFFILEDYSIRLWKEQIAAVQAKNGLVSIITHPDYLVREREQAVFIELLEHLSRLRDEGQTWTALPGEVNRWWRQRQQMTLVRRGASWRVEGAGSERARVAYAELDGDRVVYSVDPAA
jgi:hypothetical protein